MRNRIGKIRRKRVGDGYEVMIGHTYHSPRYNRSLTIHGRLDAGVVGYGFYSDGATHAWDIDSDAWVIHDHMCRYAVWDDGTPIDNWTASTVLGDILWSEGYKWRAVYWRWATYLFGGGAARKNGMRRVKQKPTEIWR